MRDAIDAIVRETGFTAEEAAELLIALRELRDGSDIRMVSLINVLLLRYDHLPVRV
jgi:hypothetical protein